MKAITLNGRYIEKTAAALDRTLTPILAGAPNPFDEAISQIVSLMVLAEKRMQDLELPIQERAKLARTAANILKTAKQRQGLVTPAVDPVVIALDEITEPGVQVPQGGPVGALDHHAINNRALTEAEAEELTRRST